MKPSKEEYQKALEIVERFNQGDTRQEARAKYIKNKEIRNRAKEKFRLLAPKITEWVKENIKPGDLIKTKGYRGVKEVVKIDGDVHALCGRYNVQKRLFIPNGSGSATTIYYVTEVFRNGKWIKIKDQIK